MRSLWQIYIFCLITKGEKNILMSLLQHINHPVVKNAFGDYSIKFKCSVKGVLGCLNVKFIQIN